MNKKSFLNAVTASLLLSTLIIGCAKDDTSDSVITFDRDKFIGTWHVTSQHTDTDAATTQFWDLTIEAASLAGAEQIVMKNFNQSGSGTTVNADVSGSDLLIPGTIINGTSGQETVEGTGNLSSSTLSLSYTSKIGTLTDTVRATATK